MERLDDRVRIERPVKDASFAGAGQGSWELVDTVWARVEDLPVSRGEQLDQGMTMAMRRGRVRIRKRDDVTAAMRFVLGSRTMQIVSGPAVTGARRDHMEFTVEEYAPAGNGGA
jgi:SPP1 family predicted phage head-tail adaptor